MQPRLVDVKRDGAVVDELVIDELARGAEAVGALSLVAIAPRASCELRSAPQRSSPTLTEMHAVDKALATSGFGRGAGDFVGFGGSRHSKSRYCLRTSHGVDFTARMEENML